MLKLKNKKVLVTGGTGTIGKVLVPKLRKMGVKVEVWSSKNDIRKVKNLDFEGVDCLVHLAAKLGGERQEIYEVNVQGTRNVLDEAIRSKVKRVLCASTVMVFEDTKGVMRDENYKKRKTTDNWYADSKIKSLTLVEEYKKRMEIVVVYPCVVLTNSQNKLIKPGRWMSLVGSGARYCNYVSVDRVADLMIKALVKGKAGQDYILGEKNVRAKDYWWLGKFIRVPEFLARIILGMVPADMYFSSRKINSI